MFLIKMAHFSLDRLYQNMINPISLASHRTGSYGIKLIPESQLSEVLLKPCEEQAGFCMDFLDIAKSPNQFVTIVNKQIASHPRTDQEIMKWDVYRKIGMKDVKEFSKLCGGFTPSGGWSTFHWSSKNHINAQIKMFRQASQQEFDIGEFIAYSDNFFPNKKEDMVFKYIKNKQRIEVKENFSHYLKIGLTEIKRHPEKYGSMPQAFFLKPFVRAFRLKDPEFSDACFKTSLNLANKDFKIALKNYKETGEISMLDGILDDIYGFGATSTNFYRGENKEILEMVNYFGERVSEYYKIKKTDTSQLNEIKKSELTRQRYNIISSMVKTIDKNFGDCTMENLYKMAEAKNLMD